MRENDFCRFVFKDKTRADFLCSELMLTEWPPPEFLNLVGRNFQRVSYSKLTEAGADMLDIARGAVYEHMPEIVVLTKQ